MMTKFSEISGIKKRGVVLLIDETDFKKIEGYVINDTVCIQGESDSVFKLANYIREKYKVPIKIVSDRVVDNLPDDIEIVNSPIQEIIGEGCVEAVKFKNGKIVGVCLVILMDKTLQLNNSAETERVIPDPLIRMTNKGLDAILSLTRDNLIKMLSFKGKDVSVSFPETNYYLPLVNALLNQEIKDLSDCLEVLGEIEKLERLKPANNGLFVETADGIFNRGIATLFCEELLAGLMVLDKKHPLGGMGFIPDKILRSLGLQLVDGRISGIALILGPAEDEETAVNLIRDFQTKSIVSLLAGNIKGNTFRKQLENRGIELGLENYIIPLGDDYLSAIYAVNFAIRAPLIFGGLKAGQWKEILEYLRNRVPAFILLLNYIDEIIAATGLGALTFGIPIITNLDLPNIGKLETTLYEALLTEKNYNNLVSKCILTRGIKTRITRIDIPVAYAPAFEGERVRRENLYVEFGGKKSIAFEYLMMKNSAEEIEDGRVELIGLDIDEVKSPDKALPLAIIVEVYGRKMQRDFEPILERQLHRFINYAQGIMHIGQRDMNWIRISNEAFAKGFRLKHIGVILHAMFHQEYSTIVDKVQVKLYTEKKDVERLLKEAKKTYAERDERLMGMTDESVDTFYSCLLCQSFAPNHVCIITPERLGLCGAYSWLDAKASYEIMPSGPNQPILKGEIIDNKFGQWKNINDFVYLKSNKTVERVSMYSLMNNPQTSCGCFECIVAIIPEVNGVMIVNRDYAGMTPCGMTFTTLAGSVGGGVQTPGFLGIGRLYIVSKKFLSAEGGLLRVVWMPKELKESLYDKLKMRAEELGYPGLLEKIADETVAVTLEELLIFLQKVEHPVLKMEPLI
ncbi:MAG: acetyl-CoA decarbonylase/synthase complex subunit alpha/beta [Candidatus Omnitrophica bacterium]|nr:acetyl-CoA decarbonylase/synthase complex subunit alpha/beta [Candidatus Omnitrophota bacterium]